MATAAAFEQFQWQPQPQAQALVNELLDGFLGCWTEHYRKQDVQRVLAPFDHVARAPGLARDAI